MSLKSTNTNSASTVRPWVVKTHNDKTLPQSLRDSGGKRDR